MTTSPEILSDVAQQALNSHLEDLAALSLVAIIAHVIAIVWWWGPQAEHVAENTNYSQEAFHLSFKTAWQAEDKKKNRFSQNHPRMLVMSSSVYNEFLGAWKGGKDYNIIIKTTLGGVPCICTSLTI